MAVQNPAGFSPQAPIAQVSKGEVMRAASRGLSKAVRRFVHRHKLAAIGGFIVVVFLFTGFLAPWLTPYDPNKVSVRHALVRPNAQFLLGTDNNGRDILSRIIFGARISLSIAIASVVAGMLFGVTLGILAGWYKKLRCPL
jgi:peptide/nickel transport system permease protein